MQKVCLVTSRGKSLSRRVMWPQCSALAWGMCSVWYVCVWPCVRMHQQTCVHVSRASEVIVHLSHSPAAIGQRLSAFGEVRPPHSATSGLSTALYSGGFLKFGESPVLTAHFHLLTNHKIIKSVQYTKLAQLCLLLLSWIHNLLDHTQTLLTWTGHRKIALSLKTGSGIPSPPLPYYPLQILNP